MVYKFFDKKTGSVVSENEQLAGQLHKLVIRKFKRRKVYVRFKGNTWAADLARMESSSSKDKNVESCVIDSFSNYAWLNLLKKEKVKHL